MYQFFQGYLLALGMSRTAQVKRDARIGEAEAGRDSGIKVWMQMDGQVSLWIERN